MELEHENQRRNYCKHEPQKTSTPDKYSFGSRFEAALVRNSTWKWIPPLRWTQNERMIPNFLIRGRLCEWIDHNLALHVINSVGVCYLGSQESYHSYLIVYSMTTTFEQHPRNVPRIANGTFIFIFSIYTAVLIDKMILFLRFRWKFPKVKHEWSNWIKWFGKIKNSVHSKQMSLN